MATENTGANENKNAGEEARRPRPADAKKPVKKKKIIIVTGNSGNSRQGSGQRGAYSSGGTGSYSTGGRKPRQGGQGQSGQRRDGAGSAAGGRRRQEPKAPAQHKIIRPSVKPSQMEVDYHKPAAQPRQPVKETAQPAAPKPADMEAAAAAYAAASVADTTINVEPRAQAQTEAPAAEPVSVSPKAQDKAPSDVSAGADTQSTAAPTPHAPKAEEQSAGAKTPDKAPAAAAAGEVKAEPGVSAAPESRREQRPAGTRRPAADRGAQAGQSAGRGQRDGQGGYRRDNRDGRTGDRQGTARRDGRTGDRTGARRDGQGASGPRTARPGQGYRQGQGSTAGRQGGRGGFAQSGGRTGSGDSRHRSGRDSDSFSRDSDKHRDDNKRKQNQDRDKRSRKDLIYNEEDTRRKNRPGRFIRPEKKVEAAEEEQIKTITIPEKLTIRELAETMHMNPSEIIKKLFLAGQIMTPNSEVSYEEAEKIALDYDILCEKEQKVDVIEELLREDEDKEEDMETRPPVVCVMGHVDHGKTSLLDEIRKTNVTGKEAGGITQAIGAYTVNVDGRSITFLDTPGHEAFTAMRMRGANSTDIAVLVVAADDGVMPQTIEAINHAKAAEVEIVVAINKIDKAGANVDRVKQELTNYELIPTDWGGSTEFVEVSAKTGEGIQDLLETILLTADILELKANPNRKARGLVLEAKLDKGRGPVANVLVQKGTLHIGDFISAGASSGKVRAMIDDKGKRVKEAKPSQPVEILGLSDVPSAGEVLVAHETNDEARAYAETYKNQHKEELIEDTKMRMNLDDLFNQMKEGNLKEFNLILKADVQGSVEALKQSLLKLSNDEVVVKVIHSGVGAITESDVTLASASNAVIIGFNVRPEAAAKSMAEHEGVDIRLYKVIYQAIDAVEAALTGMLAPVYEERVIGHVEVRQIFKASSVGNIAGSYVLDGVITRGCKCRIRRGDEQIFDGDLLSLKRYKDDVKEVKAGFECGLVFDGFDKMQVGDIVEAYDLVEVPRT